MVLNPELLGLVIVGAVLFFMLCGVWFSVRGHGAEAQSEFAQQSERMAALEERIARIEGAVFFGPSAVRALHHGSTPAESPPNS